jgi:hypothetical protein
MSDEKLIHENARLRDRIVFLEKSLQREIQWGILRARKEQTQKKSRKHFSNLLEESNFALLRQHVLETFGHDIEKDAPPYTLERLIDGEIHYKTLQSYPHMDGFAVVALYQKILDDWIELTLVRHFRDSLRWWISHLAVESRLDEDIKKVIEKKYRLSLGRFYEMLILPRVTPGTYTWEFLSYLKHEHTELQKCIVSSDFLWPFWKLITHWVFGEKRHTKKISYSDVKATREILIPIFRWLFC